MKISLFSLCSLLAISCTQNKEQKPEIKSTSFFLGTYTNGESQGIYQYLLLEDGKLINNGLSAISENPSYLAYSHDRQFLFAVNEIDQEGTGTVESYKVNGDSLHLINRSISGGAHPCYIATNEQGFVLTANYTGGNIGLLQHDQTGKLSELLDLRQHEGSGSTDRQEGPHAHFARFEPDGSGVVAVDLGTNELWFYTLNEEEKKLQAAEYNKLAMTAGAGPRHLDFHPNGRWIYVVNELDCTVVQLTRKEDGGYEMSTPLSTLPNDFSKPNTCADIHISSDGAFLYVSNRGHNSIAIYSVSPGDGSLTLIGHESTRGDSPRNFSLSPDNEFIVVANQLSNNLVSYKRDSKTGLLTFVHEVEAPAPVCILF